MKLFSHQKDALKTASKQNTVLFHDCGCGKTLTALKLIEYFKEKAVSEKRNWKKALVVCPLSIIDSAWIADCRKFTPKLPGF